MDNKQAKQNDMNSDIAGDNIKSASIPMGDVAILSGREIVTSNPFDVLNMVEMEDAILPTDSMNEKARTKVEEDPNDTARFLASKSEAKKSSKVEVEPGWRAYTRVGNRIMMIVHIMMMSVKI
ncbi:hypothetical protein CTI12_AA227160 [Artemisia annua]|uniref:Uncharacterized protein n=1 Tax=Artemisia annua TaxID=35608 RepID=A0A2U1NUU0_ARTAN|nr:hypothetical protein CTI12_AA227160 [Artemisia annua]